MTIEARTTVIPEKREVNITAAVDPVTFVTTLRESCERVVIYDGWGGKKVVELYNDEIDAMIELLHAIKSSANGAATTMQRLAETVDEPHLDIIAVDEPTA